MKQLQDHRRTAADYARILKWRESGLTYAQIGWRLGRSESRAQQLVRVAKWKREPNFDGAFISPRLANCLHCGDCWTFAEAARKPLRWWLEMPNFGYVVAVELGEILRDRLLWAVDDENADLYWRCVFAVRAHRRRSLAR